MFFPKVSILIPCYNHEIFITETILSAVTQTYENIEIIVCDDASSDQTPQILKNLEKEVALKIKVLLHEKNLGVTKNHTRGLLACTGDFIAFLDGDDLFLPEKIEKQIAFMRQNPDCSLLYHDVDVFNSSTGKTLYYWSERIGSKTGQINDLIRFGNFLPAVAVMVRASDIPPAGYDERIIVYSDWLFWLSTLYKGKGKICYLNETLARYRRHTDNFTNTSQWKFIDQNRTLDIIRTTWPEFRFEIRMRRSELCFMQALNSLSKKQLRPSIKNFFYSFLYGFPLAPWMRLILREIHFLIKNKFQTDYILKSNLKT